MFLFVIQTNKGIPCFDFSFQLLKSIEYCNNNSSSPEYTYYLTPKVPAEIEFKKGIPIGSLDFVFDFIQTHHGIETKYQVPLNIPAELMKPEFTGREITVQKPSTFNFKGSRIIKTKDEYKDILEVIQAKDKRKFPDKDFLVSEIISIKAEFRVFIYSGIIVGVHYYCGDHGISPDMVAVQKMIRSYTNAPSSYSIDVAVTETGTFIVEAHPFVSCGLYGFNTPQMIPPMSIQGYKYLLDTARKLKQSD